jgi:hypothetical protein
VRCENAKVHLTSNSQLCSGARAVSMASMALMLVLVVNEIWLYTSRKQEHHLLVDTRYDASSAPLDHSVRSVTDNFAIAACSQGERDVEIRFDVVFHLLKCPDIDLRVEDSKGVPYEASHIIANRVPQVDGFDAPGSGQAHTGCRIHGVLGVKKVAGNFHFIANGAARMMPMLDPRFGFGFNPAELSKHNASHTVRKLAFGPAFPGQLCPLDGVSSEPTEHAAMYQHYIKVVPTVYEFLDGSITDSNQFSATDFAIQMAPAEGVIVQPGVWFRWAGGAGGGAGGAQGGKEMGGLLVSGSPDFRPSLRTSSAPCSTPRRYDFSPIMVRVVEQRLSIAQLLVNLCAILGGAFALSGVVDQVGHRLFGQKEL